MTSYERGVAETLRLNGVNEKLAESLAEQVSGLRKKASMFNFSDHPDYGGGFSWSSVLIPLLAAAGAGYVGYQAGIGGDKDKSFLHNAKNFAGRFMDKYLRREKPLPFYDYRRYMSV